MLVFVLVIWFGTGTSQTTFAVPGISSLPECQRLGRALGSGAAKVVCQPYRSALK